MHSSWDEVLFFIAAEKDGKAALLLCSILGMMCLTCSRQPDRKSREIDNETDLDKNYHSLNTGIYD